MGVRSPRYWVVGLGRVGSLIARLVEGERTLAGIAVKDAADLERARRLSDASVTIHALPDAVDDGVTVLLCVPDGALASAAFQWRKCGARSFVHFSGALGTMELQERLGGDVSVAGLHPLLSVSTHDMSPADARGVTFGLSGDGPARAEALRLAELLGGHVVEVDESARAAWHLAATIASNGVYALLNVATQIAASAGITGFDVERGLASLAAQSAQAAARHGAVEGATGPVVRGDASTVDRHLRVLEQMPDARALYTELTRALIEVAEMRGTSDQALVAIRALIESYARR